MFVRILLVHVILQLFYRLETVAVDLPLYSIYHVGEALLRPLFLLLIRIAADPLVVVLLNGPLDHDRPIDFF